MNGNYSRSRESVDLAGQLAATIVGIFASCGFSSGEILSLMKKAIRELAHGPNPQNLTSSVDEHLACTDIVFVWRHDPRFVDEDGEPKVLQASATGGSFAELVAVGAPGQDSGVLLDYLVGLGAVRYIPDVGYALATESVLACSGINGGRIASEVVLLHLLGFLGSVEYNLRKKTSNDSGRFERACYSRIPANLAPIFEKLVETRGQNFVDTIDEWLVRHRSASVATQESVLVGAGAYMFQRRVTKSTS